MRGFLFLFFKLKIHILIFSSTWWSSPVFCVSCAAGGFFTAWATGEALKEIRKTGRCCTACCLVTNSCPAPFHPMDCSPPGSSVHGGAQASILEGVAIPFPRRPSHPQIEPRLLHCRVVLLPSLISSILCPAPISQPILFYCQLVK